jgi:hypothetical protein
VLKTTNISGSDCSASASMLAIAKMPNAIAASEIVS